jgi:hypothetical protein
MFLRNDVIQYAEAARMVRILWIAQDGISAWVFELGQPRSLPQALVLTALADDVLARRARLLRQDPCAPPPPPALLPARQHALQAKAWQIVSSMQGQAPDLYLPRERGVMVARCAEQYGVSRPSVLRYLRRYWERGQTIRRPAARLRQLRRAGKTRARPRRQARTPAQGGASGLGLNVDAAIRATFRAAVARYCATHPVFSRRAAYAPDAGRLLPGGAPGAVPSFGQFSYWLDKDAMAGSRTERAPHGAAAYRCLITNPVQHSP